MNDAATVAEEDQAFRNALALMDVAGLTADDIRHRPGAAHALAWLALNPTGAAELLTAVRDAEARRCTCL